MGTFSNSIGLVKASWRVLRDEPGMAWLPVIAALASIVVAATFALPVIGADAVFGDGDASFGGALDWVLIVLFYFVGAFITIFFNAAVVFAANERLEGRDTNVSAAIAGAAKRWRLVLEWSIVTTTVNIVLRAIAERFGFVGTIVAGLLGLAWSLVTFLALPILVIEGVGVRDALKKSGALFKKTWGENVVGNGGIGLIGFLVSLPAAALLAGGIALMANDSSLALGVLLVVLGAVAFAVIIPLMTALSGIFQTALYRFANDGQLPKGFEQTNLAHAFRPKTGGRAGGI